MTHDLFLPREINRNEQNFLRRFMMSDAVMIFLSLKNIPDTSNDFLT